MDNTNKTRSQRCRGQIGPGFALVELLVVIAILALLLGLLMPSINAAYQNAQITASQSTVNLISSAVEMFRNDFNDLPPQRLGWWWWESTGLDRC